MEAKESELGHGSLWLMLQRLLDRFAGRLSSLRLAGPGDAFAWGAPLGY